VAEHVARVELAAVGRSLSAVPPAALLLALTATSISFLAAGRFDAAVHRWLGTGADEAAAVRTGAAAVAVSQTTGFGLITGALARWRGLPGLPLIGATRVTAAVTGAFMCALAAAILLAGLVTGLPHGAPDWVLAPGAAVLIVYPVLALLPCRPAGLVPPLALALPLLSIATIDLLAASAAFWILLPPDPAFAAAAVLPAFLLALAAGLVSGTPGGVGPFEITLLALLPGAPQAELLAAIFGFRLVYYAIPGVAGAAWLALRDGDAATAPTSAPLTSATLAAASRAEAGLVRQGDLGVLTTRGGTLVGSVTGQAMVVVGDPIRRVPPGESLAVLGAEASARGRLPLLYKCGARLAGAARASGWAVVPVAEEAWIAPAAFRLATPARRRLRRKLRAAEAAGVEVGHRDGPLPLREMEAVAAEWARSRGGERGFSMGRFAPGYASAQRVYLAHHAGRLAAFVTFHQGAREWTLDLVRARDDAPDGTTFALVAAAIADAAAARLPRVSLAAVRAEGLWHPAASRLARRIAPDGLRQFKAAFDPAWETLYAAAPGRLSLALGLWDVAWRIRRPIPLPAATMQEAQDRHENYPVAAGRPCMASVRDSTVPAKGAS
jgi:phosphatidylglycerol lysyltransferase